MDTTNYPSFDYEPSALSAFSFSIDTFIVSLKNGTIIHFVPEDATAFKHWLICNGVRDIKENDGIPASIKIDKPFK